MKNFIDIGAFEIGHKFGMNPLETIDSMIKANTKQNFLSLIEGFEQGRKDYAEFNGNLNQPAPQRVLSFFALSEVMFEAALGMQMEVDCYTSFQVEHVKQWHERGQQGRNIDNEITLGALLQSQGIN